MIVRLGWALALTALAAVGLLPDLLWGLDRRSPFAQLVAFRPWLLLGGAIVALGLALLTWRRRGAWPFTAGVLAVVAVGAALVVPRAVADPAPPPGPTLTVLSANVYEGQADPAALAALIRSSDPDVVVLPESGARFSARITPLVADLGYRPFVSAAPGTPDVEGVSALVAPRLGDVAARIGTETFDPYLEISGGALGALRVVAFHSAAPTRERITHWLSDLSRLPRWCAGTGPAIVAGDFNATLDHSALRAAMRGCSDAAAQRGAGLLSTWGPSQATRRFGPQIDHVLTTAGLAATAFGVHDLPGSDHRAIVATVTR